MAPPEPSHREPRKLSHPSSRYWPTRDVVAFIKHLQPNAVSTHSLGWPDRWQKSLRYRTRLYLPYVGRIFLDRPITRELARSCNIQNCFARPIARLRVQFHQTPVCVEVGPQIGQMHVEVSMRQERVAERCENLRLVEAEVIGEDQV